MEEYNDVFRSLEEDENSVEELIATVKLLTNTIIIERHSLDAVHTAMLAGAEPEEVATIERFYQGVQGHKMQHLMMMVFRAQMGNYDLDFEV